MVETGSCPPRRHCRPSTMKNHQQQCCFKLAQSSRWIEIWTVRVRHGAFLPSNLHRAIFPERSSQKNLYRDIHRRLRLKVMFKVRVPHWPVRVFGRQLNKRNSFKKNVDNGLWIIGGDEDAFLPKVSLLVGSFGDLLATIAVDHRVTQPFTKWAERTSHWEAWTFRPNLKIISR